MKYRLHLFLCLPIIVAGLLCAGVAQAGHYTIAYTGGTWSTPDHSGSYTLTSDGYYGGYADYGAFSFAPWSQCTGQITATCTWVPDYPGEPPPHNVIVCEEMEADAQGDGDGCNGNSDDGIGDTASYNPDSPVYDAYSTNYRYSVKSDAVGFTLQCLPNSYTIATDGFVQCEAYYQVTITPVILNLGGTVSASDGAHILIGQGCTASVSAGIYTLANYGWSVHGLTFGSFQITPDQTPDTLMMSPNPHGSRRTRIGTGGRTTRISQ